MRRGASHKCALWTAVFVGECASVVAVRIGCSVVRVIFVPAASSHDEGKSPGVCSHVVIEIVQGHVEVLLVPGHVVKHEYGVGGSHIVAVESPVAGRPHQIVGRDDGEAAVGIGADGRVVVGEPRHRGDKSGQKGVSLAAGNSVALRFGDRRKDELCKGEKNVGVDVFVVGHPAARIESALVPHVTAPEIGKIVAVIVRVIVDGGILVKVEGVGRILGRIPEREGCCGSIVVKGAASRVKTE